MPLPKREFSKSKMSMYLRTLCERELYLSLFSNNPGELGKAGIPVPLKSRPGVQLITSSGREFEYQQYNVLCSSLPNNVYCASRSLERAFQDYDSDAEPSTPSSTSSTMKSASLRWDGLAAFQRLLIKFAVARCLATCESCWRVRLKRGRFCSALSLSGILPPSTSLDAHGKPQALLGQTALSLCDYYLNVRLQFKTYKTSIHS